MVEWYAARYQANLAIHLKKYGLRYDDLYDPAMDLVRIAAAADVLMCMQQPQQHCAQPELQLLQQQATVSSSAATAFPSPKRRPAAVRATVARWQRQPAAPIRQWRGQQCTTTSAHN